MIDSHRTAMWDVRRPNLHVDVIQNVLDRIGYLELVIVLLEGLSQSESTFLHTFLQNINT